MRLSLFILAEPEAARESEGSRLSVELPEGKVGLNKKPPVRSIISADLSGNVAQQEASQGRQFPL